MVFCPRGWKSAYSTAQILENKKVVQREEVLQQWYRIIIAYSSLKLTYDADRLPALAGLASRFAETLNTPYLAGLWLSDLSRGLLWNRSWRVPCRRLSGPGPGTTIPTQSQASIIPISDAHSHDSTTTPLTESSIQHQSQCDDVRFIILAATCTGINTFGRVSRGVLQIRGTIVEIPLLQHQGREPLSYYLRFGHQQYNYPLRTRGYNFHDLIFDVVSLQGTSEEILPGDSLYCLLVGYSESQNELEIARRTVFYLVLKNIQGRTFERVGFLSQDVNDKDWFQNAKVTEIEIQ